MLDLPSSFIQTIRSTYGIEGETWLASLPDLLEEATCRWGLLNLRPCKNLSYNYIVFAGKNDGTQVVLKLGIPNAELTCEIAALKAYDGKGAVRLLEAEIDRGFLLMERAVPGNTLVRMSLEEDKKATVIAAQVMCRLMRPLTEQHPFHPIEYWTRAIRRTRQRFGSSYPIPDRIADQAQNLLADLLASSGTPILLHGDLHHANILSADNDEWLAIDPKGVAGDPAYQPAALLINLWSDTLTKEEIRHLTENRIRILAETLNLDRKSIWGWGFVHALLSASWDLDEGNVINWRNAWKVAEVFSGMQV